MVHLACPSLPSKLTSLPGKNVQHPYSVFLITATSRMERNAIYNEHLSYLDTDRIGRARQHPHSSPLPSREWPAPPSPNRLQHRSSNERQRHHDDQRPASARHVNSPRHESDARDLQQGTTSRQRARKRRIRDVLFRRDVEPHPEPERTDFSRLYPVQSPYDNRFSVYSAPEDLEHESLEHEDEALDVGYLSPTSAADPSPFNLPRSPTYPPVTRSRSYNSVIDDAALADAAEFHLFVQATVGLGLDDASDQTDSDPSPVSLREPQGVQTQTSAHVPTIRSPVSPLEEASMTIRAMQHMAQIPDGSHLSNPEFSTRSQPTRVASAPVQLTLEDFEDFNEDLPDYEESQTQAWSSRRAEATRRAQELQMRWRLTGARRGVM